MVADVGTNAAQGALSGQILNGGNIALSKLTEQQAALGLAFDDHYPIENLP